MTTTTTSSSYLGNPLTHVDIDEIDRVQLEERNESHCSTGAYLTSKQRQTIKASKPWEQVVTDEEGRRRFHGAFTGGFSAGYYNTVGTKEGWTPSTFVSSRSSSSYKNHDNDNDRRQKRHQKISDFMDDEDYNEGIGKEYDAGAITTTTYDDDDAGGGGSGGIEVRDRVGLSIMKNQGWREGTLVGEISNNRLLFNNKDDNDENRKRKVYTFSSLPPNIQKTRFNYQDLNTYEDDGEGEEEEERIHNNIIAIHRWVDRMVNDGGDHKDNMHGIGYSGTLRSEVGRTTRTHNETSSLSSSPANELLSSIFGDDDDARNEMKSSNRRQGGGLLRQKQQVKHNSMIIPNKSTQAVGAFGIGVFDEADGGDGYDIDVYDDEGNDYYQGGYKNKTYSTTVVEIDDDDGDGVSVVRMADNNNRLKGKSHNGRNNNMIKIDDKVQGIEVVDLINDDNERKRGQKRDNHNRSTSSEPSNNNDIYNNKRSKIRNKNYIYNNNDDTLDGMFTASNSASSSSTSSIIDNNDIIISSLIPEPPSVPKGFRSHLHIPSSSSNDDGTFRDTSPEYQRLIKWLRDNSTSTSSSNNNHDNNNKAMTMKERSNIISGKEGWCSNNKSVIEARTTHLSSSHNNKGGGGALWSNVDDAVRREALLAAVGGRTINMHKESSTTTSSSSSLSLEVFNGDPDKRRRYEIFCNQMASGAPTLSAHCNVNFKELKEFTKLYESINNEDSAGSSSSRHGKDKKVTNEIDDETTSYESNNNLTTPAAQIAEALKILQPSKHVECNWKAEPLVCKRFGCPDPWRHKKFYDDSYEALNKGQRSRWAGGKDRYNRRYKQQQQRDDDKGSHRGQFKEDLMKSSRMNEEDSSTMQHSPPPSCYEPSIILQADELLPTKASRKPPQDLFTDIFGD